jgi:hypothetical protein
MLLLLLLAAAEPDPLLAKASSRLSVSDEAKPPSDYRIDREDTGSATSTKDRALAEDGGRCSLIGGKVCTRKPRTWLKTDLDPRP